MSEPLVVHVNEKDEVLGFYPKMVVHEKSMLHRAVSVLIFNSKGEWLIQKRAAHKYHSGGLWTNTCCSHPYPNEDVKTAAERRLVEEMGMHCELEKVFDFIYKSALDNELTEYEFDHVFTGYTDDLPKLNPEEADDWEYLSTEELLLSMKIEPQNYTEWFKILLPKALEEIEILRAAC